MKPIRILYSSFSQRFYASRAYKQVRPGIVEITGQKFDVTDEIGEIVTTHNLEFTRREPAAPEGFRRADNGDPDTIVPAPAPHKKRPAAQEEKL